MQTEPTVIPRAPARGMTRQAPLVLMLLLAECSRAGAPSFVLFGSYFPAWMLCATLGVAGGVVMRALFVATGLASLLPYQLYVCTAGGVIVAVGAWLL